TSGDPITLLASQLAYNAGETCVYLLHAFSTWRNNAVERQRFPDSNWTRFSEFDTGVAQLLARQREFAFFAVLLFAMFLFTVLVLITVCMFFLIFTMFMSIFIMLMLGRFGCLPGCLGVRRSVFVIIGRIGQVDVGYKHGDQYGEDKSDSERRIQLLLLTWSH